MKLINYIIILFLFSNCSFNNNSSFWTDNNKKNLSLKDGFNEILIKSNNVMKMNFEEYKIYIEDYKKKSKYPDISK
tara:strand:+ start:2029 stop:2256 length:228 start_codon:yes stop_codon:yes gene_type:complete